MARQHQKALFVVGGAGNKHEVQSPISEIVAGAANGIRVNDWWNSEWFQTWLELANQPQARERA